MVFLSILEISTCSETLVHAITDGVRHHRHGNLLQNSTAREKRSLGHCRRDQSR
jgi:hypothetical protein